MPTYLTTITVQVQCINKTNRDAADERIRAIGGASAGGRRWKLTTDEAIAGIESGEFRFYVERPIGQRVWVVVAVSARGRKYLKTEADGEQPNNLLALPECP